VTRIYISEQGSDKNDGLTKHTPIYSWKRASKLAAGYLEISVDSASQGSSAEDSAHEQPDHSADQRVRNEGMHGDVRQ
jgi:hypothetical protein